MKTVWQWLRKDQKVAAVKLGFQVSGKLYMVTETQFDDWWDSFITDAIERAGLFVGGGGPAQEWSYMVWRPIGDVSVEDREHVVAWLAADQRIESFQAGQLIDLNQDDT